MLRMSGMAGLPFPLCPQNEPPDLILLHLQLGKDLDGADTAQQLLLLGNIPILFLYSPADLCRIKKAAPLAVYGYVDQHSLSAVLLASVQAALRLHETRKLAQSSENRYQGACHRPAGSR